MSKAKALSDLQAAMPTIKHNAENKHYGNAYATFDHILDMIKPKLHEHGAALIHQISETEVRTTLLFGEFEWVSCFKLPSNETNPQKIGSAITYGKRYNTAGLLDLTIQGEDDDGNNGAEGAAEAEEKRRKQQTAQSKNQPEAQTRKPTHREVIDRMKEMAKKPTRKAVDWAKNYCRNNKQHMTEVDYMEAMDLLQAAESNLEKAA